jgi:hypothetical protein
LGMPGSDQRMGESRHQSAVARHAAAGGQGRCGEARLVAAACR